MTSFDNRYPLHRNELVSSPSFPKLEEQTLINIGKITVFFISL